MSIVLTPLQDKAKKLINDWYNGKYTSRYPDPNVFVLGGIAGSGKSTMLFEAINELGLEIGKDVIFCTFTGMAASVLSRKKCPAATIHRTIYNIAKIQDKKTKKYKYVYRLKTKDEMDGIKLIVNDEASMTPPNILEELRSFGIKILTVGDPEQLPPIAGSNNLFEYMDVFLDEPHRQALDNPIFWLANEVRLGNYVDYGRYGGNVQIVPKLSVSEDNLVKLIKTADQVMVAKNKTAKYINDLYRARVLDIYPEDNKPLPTVGEKMMCVKNNWGNSIKLENGAEIFLVNGIIGYLDGLVETHQKANVSNILFRPEFSDNSYDPIMMDNVPFEDARVDPKGDNVLDYYPKLQLHRHDEAYSNLDYFVFAYACTIHKLQGSSMKKGLLIEEVLNKKWHKNLLYTAITRAEEKLIILR